ncbi:MAG TPA: helicase-related protein [Roseiflexaceae bacterium]|nr:helicase-related protein [Roseiflexaceae bacterium]
MARFEAGSLVRCREREWVVLPSDQEDVLLLRPLGGAEAEVCGIYLPFEGNGVSHARFRPPDPRRGGDFVSGRLLRDAARLALRSGAGPFRSLGRLGVRPRPYQLVPLIMALRLDPVRLLIADDVGIGKTIEAALIARELLDRGEIRRLTVLCPPHLCDQWQRELAEKFAIEAVVVRASTAASLERALPRGDVSIFDYFPFTVASIDYVKSDRRRDSFLRACPELVIVDEAHTATSAGGRGAGQQQRYELVRDLAAREDRHLLLLTATPHSGIEDAFRSLLGLLAPRFERFSLERMPEAERDDLARHLVQRRRADVRHWLGEETPFPLRESAEATYTLPRTAEYRRLFDDVYEFTRELVRTAGANGQGRSWKQRARYWAALALLRCVMSSPAAAEKALRVRAAGVDEALDADLDAAGADEQFSGYVYDPTDQEGAQDLEPGHVVEQGAPSSGERARLLRFAARAAALTGAGDPKLQKVLAIVEGLLRDGYNPIVYCRYIATANYLASELAGRIKGDGSDSAGRPGQGLRVLAVTGERTEEEREALIAELERSPRRLLIATDCLSEGINLQQSFDAVVHYDLPWNPNRLEQREGRVDRYGQPSATVRTVLLYGDGNPVDEAVMKVLLRKAVSIHRTLGISVPLPVDSGTVVETLIGALFRPAPQQTSFLEPEEQLALLDADEAVRSVELAWDRAAEREKESRTRFAQRRIRPDEVLRELEESDAVLGDAAAVERFVRAALERLNTPVAQGKRQKAKGKTAAEAEEVWEISAHALPAPVLERLREHVRRQQPGAKAGSEPSTITLSPSTLTRSHPLTAALADYMLETALAPEDGEQPAARCGLIRTDAVARRTVLLLLRVRMLMTHTPARSAAGSARQAAPTLAEELVVCGYTRAGGVVEWLDEAQALALLETAQPRANVTVDERTIGVERALEDLEGLRGELERVAGERAERLRAAHQRVRSVTTGGRVDVRPHLPADVLGVYVLLPMPRGLL